MRGLMSFILIIIIGISGASAQSDGDDGRYQRIVRGTIDNATPFTEISFTVPQDGSTIILDLMAVGENPGQLDTFLYLLDATGVIIDENDDRQRGVLDARIEFPFAAAGEYTAIATRYGVANGASFGEFELLIDIAPTESRINLDYDVSPEALREMGWPEFEPRPTADWTIFAYYGGDNNLEWGLQADFNQFEMAGGSTDEVRILMLFDRSPEHSTDNGDWRTMRLFEVQADISDDATIRFPPTLDSEPLVDFGPFDSGSGDTFAKFLAWGLRHYPAENYAVALASHGAGWRGIITDDSAAAEIPRVSHTIISVPEMREALQLATQAAGVERFDLLINDACSMSSIEYYSGVASFFDMSLASPEIVVDPALNMTLLTNRLKAEGRDVDLVDLGADLINQYIQIDIYASGDADADYFTHALTDLTRFDAVERTVENFARVFNSNPTAYAETLGAARANAYTYTHFAGRNREVDLGSLMRRLIAEARDVELIEAAELVLIALDQAIIYSNAGNNITSDVSYYSIYFPEASSGFSVAYFEQSPLVEWGRMLRNYYNAVTPQVWTGDGVGLEFHPPKAPIVTIANVFPEDGVVNVLNPFNVRFQIEARNISHGDATFDFIQPDGTIVRYGSDRLLRPVINEQGETQLLNIWDDGVSDEQFFWDAGLPVVSDGSSTNNELVIIRENVAFLDGWYRGPNDQNFSEVSVVFTNALNDPDGIGRTQRVISRADDTNALAVITIPTGSEFIANRSIVTPDGRVVVEEGNRYTWPEGGLTYTNEPAPSGQYNIGLLIEAIGGTTGHFATETTVDNDGLMDSDLRGRSILSIGFTLTYPKTWSFLTTDPAFVDRSFSPDRLSNVAVYYPDPSFVDPDDIESIVDDVFDFYFPDLTWDRQYDAITVDGNPGIAFTFEYESEQGIVDVRAFAAFNAAGNSGFVFASEAVRGAGDIDGIYDQLLANVRIFPPVSIQQAAGGLWDFSFYRARGRQPFRDGVEYPVPSAWQPVADGMWTRYSDDPAGETFIAFSVVAGDNVTAKLNTVITRDALAEAQNLALLPVRILNTRYHRWTARPYEVTRDGRVYQGRVYGTLVNDEVFLIWTEAPDGEVAEIAYARNFEPMVDRFSISE